jgi:hypothetical protein
LGSVDRADGAGCTEPGSCSYRSSWATSSVGRSGLRDRDQSCGRHDVACVGRRFISRRRLAARCLSCLGPRVRVPRDRRCSAHPPASRLTGC